MEPVGIRIKVHNVCMRSQPARYYDWTWGGPRRLRMIAERIWKKGAAIRWNRKVDKIYRVRREKRMSKDPACKARIEERIARYEARMEEETEIEESWHNSAYIDEGPTPDWVMSLADEDPMEF